MVKHNIMLFHISIKSLTRYTAVLVGTEACTIFHGKHECVSHGKRAVQTRCFSFRFYSKHPFFFNVRDFFFPFFTIIDVGESIKHNLRARVI